MRPRLTVIKYGNPDMLMRSSCHILQHRRHTLLPSAVHQGCVVVVFLVGRMHRVLKVKGQSLTSNARREERVDERDGQQRTQAEDRTLTPRCLEVRADRMTRCLSFFLSLWLGATCVVLSELIITGHADSPLQLHQCPSHTPPSSRLTILSTFLHSIYAYRVLVRCSVQAELY